MKGWQNCRQITQKICCSDEIANKVKQIEHNMYLMIEGKGFWIYKFPFDQCFSLHDLIESIKDKSVMIYKGQVLLIIQKIIEHLYEIHQINLTHDNLNAQNIYINFAKDSNSLTTYQQFIKIDSVYFLNYKCLQVELKQYSFSDDQNAIKKTILQLIEILFDEKEDLTQIVQEFTNKNAKSNTNKLLKQINVYITNNLVQQNQTLKMNEITNYNSYTKLRYNYEGVIQQQVQKIFSIEKQCAQQLEEYKLDFPFIEIEKIKQFLFQNFYITLMKRFHKYAGNLLETKYVIKEQDFITYFDELEIDQTFEFKFSQLKYIFYNVQQIPVNILKRFQQSYKFQFEEFNQKKLFQLYENFFFLESINFDTSIETEFLKMLDVIYVKMQKYLEEYYDLECQLKILELINGLI